MSHGAGGGLGHHSGEPGTAALGDHHAVGSGALGSADDCAQVVGIRDLIADHQQGVLPLVGSALEDTLHADVLPHGGQGDDPLVGVGAAHAVQLTLVRLHHHDARSPGLGGDVSQGLVRLPLLEVDLVDGLPCPQGLDDGVAAFDDAVGLSGEIGFLLFVHRFPPSVFFSHTYGSIPHQAGTIKWNSQKFHQKEGASPCRFPASVIYFQSDFESSGALSFSGF